MLIHNLLGVTHAYSILKNFKPKNKNLDDWANPSCSWEFLTNLKRQFFSQVVLGEERLPTGSHEDNNTLNKNFMKQVRVVPEFGTALPQCVPIFLTSNISERKFFQAPKFCWLQRSCKDFLKFKLFSKVPSSSLEVGP